MDIASIYINELSQAVIESISSNSSFRSSVQFNNQTRLVKAPCQVCPANNLEPTAPVRVPSSFLSFPESACVSPTCMSTMMSQLNFVSSDFSLSNHPCNGSSRELVLNKESITVPESDDSCQENHKKHISISKNGEWSSSTRSINTENSESDGKDSNSDESCAKFGVSGRKLMIERFNSKTTDFSQIIEYPSVVSSDSRVDSCETSIIQSGIDNYGAHTIENLSTSSSPYVSLVNNLGGVKMSHRRAHSPNKKAFKSAGKSVEKTSSPKFKASKRGSFMDDLPIQPAIVSPPSSPGHSPRKTLNLLPGSPLHRFTPQAKRITAFSGSFLSQQKSGLPMFADVLLPLKISNEHLNEDVAGAYTLDRGDVFVSVAAPMPITDSEIIEESIRSAERQLIREFQRFNKPSMLSSISRRLFGESAESLHTHDDDASEPRSDSSKFQKRRQLDFFIDRDVPCESDESLSTYKVTLSVHHTEFEKKSKSPRGQRNKTLEFVGFESKVHAERFAEAMAPPCWKDSKTCYICRHGFSILKKGHHCRNCGQTICSSCSSKSFPGTTLPHTFHNNEKFVRICSACTYLSTLFHDALLSDDLDRVKILMETGAINLRSPIIVERPSQVLPVHLAAQGGSLDIMKWLLDDMKCPISENGSPLKTSDGLSCLSIACKFQNTDIMNYLISELDTHIDEICNINTIQRGLHLTIQGSEDPTSSEKGRRLSDVLSTWLGSSTRRKSKESATASLITGNPSAGFLIEANVAAVIPQSALSRVASSQPRSSLAYSPGSPDTTATQPSNSSNKPITPVNGNNHAAKILVENELLRLEMIMCPRYVMNSNNGDAAITLPYEDEDVIDFSEYALRNILGPKQRKVPKHSIVSQNRATSNGTMSRGTRQNDDRDIQRRRTVTSSQVHYSRPSHLGEVQDPRSNRRYSGRNNQMIGVACSIGPGAHHVIPRRSDRRIPHASLDSLLSSSYTPEQQRRIAAASARLLRARAEMDVQQRESRRGLNTA